MPVTKRKYESFADVIRALGNIPLNRILWNPPPGTATEADQLLILERDKRRVELIGGILVEKAMGYREATLAMLLGRYILNFLDAHNLGVAAGADGPMRMRPGRVRLPDVSFTAWANLPTPDAHQQPVADFAPDLAVEVISRGNTAREMTRKRRDYFRRGTRLVWMIHPEARTVAIYTDTHSHTTLTESDTLTGGDVLPGFELSLSTLFNHPQLQPPPGAAS